MILKGSSPAPLTHTSPSMGASSPLAAGLVPSHREELCSNDLPQDSCLELHAHHISASSLPLPARSLTECARLLEYLFLRQVLSSMRGAHCSRHQPLYSQHLTLPDAYKVNHCWGRNGPTASQASLCVSLHRPLDRVERDLSISTGNQHESSSHHQVISSTRYHSLHGKWDFTSL